jgi:hypothetical protein
MPRGVAKKDHPDWNEIDTLLSKGESPRDIEEMLKKRYPHEPQKWMDHSNFYVYRAEE